MLAKYDFVSEGTEIIPLFTSQIHEIPYDNKRCHKKKFSIRPEYEIIGDENCKRVDYAIKAEFETKNSEISKFRKRLAKFEARDIKIHELRKKVVEVETKNAELIKQMMEENNRREARIEDLEKNTTDRVMKLEQK
ncbi:hypothetical protein C1645_738388 [Glomus cerebriforme]|uniref:Uncharacterized protein n=1 Tax=Glomus cerebriforme TaxID=658196 RepID=A0A397T3Y1_9GLOM|nr:hypothetical protein C1645_738388 [Glomus cerebriforme]